MNSKQVDAIVSVCDPGIQSVVRTLLEAGLPTTDSGDGVTKLREGWDRDEVLDYPHVWMCFDRKAQMDDAAMMLADMIRIHPEWPVKEVCIPKWDPHEPVDNGRWIIGVVGPAVTHHDNCTEPPGCACQMGE